MIAFTAGRLVNTSHKFMLLNATSRCQSDATCLRVHDMEPSLPIAPSFMPAYKNPCFESGSNPPVCLPFVHIISGWHMFSDEALGFLKVVKQVEMRGGDGCFDDWEGDGGSSKWVASFGGVPSADRVIMTHCNKLLSWYPAFAGRYTSAWGKSYGPCKTEYVAKGGDYYGKYMWPICRPRALEAHDRALGTGGVGHEATPPFVMRTLYNGRARVISALRHPVDRVEASFWLHQHYPRKYGQSPAGLHGYLQEQTAAFDACAAKHGTRRCAFLFELLGQTESDVFFHCDQIIRSLYEPFLADWHAALGATGFLALRVDDLLDRPAPTRARLLRFLGLPTAAADSLPAPSASYAALHAASLKAGNAQPMRSDTRQLAERWFQKDLDRVGLLFPDLTWPRGSTVVDAAAIANAASGHGARNLR